MLAELLGRQTPWLGVSIPCDLGAGAPPKELLPGSCSADPEEPSVSLPDFFILPLLNWDWSRKENESHI